MRKHVLLARPFLTFNFQQLTKQLTAMNTTLVETNTAVTFVRNKVVPGDDNDRGSVPFSLL